MLQSPLFAIIETNPSNLNTIDISDNEELLEPRVVLFSDNHLTHTHTTNTFI